MHLLNNESAKDRLHGPGAIDGPVPTPIAANGRQPKPALTIDNDHLDALEAQSIYIFREAFARLKKLALLWSLGKDSNVMVWLAKKAFFGHVPFPVMHIDTGQLFLRIQIVRIAGGQVYCGVLIEAGQSARSARGA